MTDSTSKPKEKHGKKTRKDSDKETHPQGNEIETISSVIRRLFGSRILSRKPEAKYTEVQFRVLAYNLHRKNLIADLMDTSV